MPDIRHVVLVKPGDTLLLGNVGEVDPETLERIGAAFGGELGIHVVVFSADIDMDAVAGGSG